jgi:hypothetical protein
MKTTNYRRTIFSLVKGCLLLIGGLVILPYPTKAQCKQWDVSGKWILNVEKGASETLDLKQEGTNIKGKSLLGLGGGPVLGTVEGDDFAITIDWAKPGNTVAPGAADFEIFKGKIGSDGIIHGFGSTRNNPDLSGKNKNPWSSNRPMTCTARAPRVIKHTGRPKVDPAPNPSIEPSANAPMISATPNNGAFVPGKIAHTVIRWDGGPDHPYAELWVRVNDEDEKFVIEQGKGSRQMVVEPGKTYLYILTDSGTTLATVTVKFHQ